MRNFVYKSFAFCAFMALSLSLSAQGNHYYSNNTLTDPYGKFQLYMPGEPQYTYSDLDTEMGKVRMYQFMHQGTTAIYMASYVDYPADKLAGQNVDVLLKNAAGGFIGALKLTSRSENIINYGKNKGIMFYADNAEYFVVMRDFMVDNRLFQIGILSFSGEININAENDFFDSFVLK